MDDEIEQLETLPEGAIAMKPVQGPDGGFYLVPDTGSAGTMPGTVDGAAAAAPDMLAWARPIIADPVGWAQTNLLNLDVLLPLLWQGLAIIGALFLGIVLTSRVRKLVMAGLARLPEGLSGAIDETAPKLVRPALWAGLLYAAQAGMAGAGLGGRRA